MGTKNQSEKDPRLSSFKALYEHQYSVKLLFSSISTEAGLNDEEANIKATKHTLKRKEQTQQQMRHSKLEHEQLYFFLDAMGLSVWWWVFVDLGILVGLSECYGKEIN